MYLKSMELQGFKSFPDRTKLAFDRGMIAVVGPNGSGKSNIGDAIRWVLGEQSTKTLRGAKMEDVIFGGTVKRRPSGFAQVQITFDNTGREFDIDSDEVTISRKFYRSGESEYRINQMNVRLKDIHELLMDTGIGRDGYSIIGQGRIAEIVSAKSTDRREIFEEAAGISKFRYRKEEALKRLALAQENLLRLNDILGEIEGRIEPLRIQSQKAKKFVELEEQRKTLQISLWVSQLKELKERIRKQQEQILSRQSEYDANNAALQRTEQEIERIYADIQKLAVSAEEVRSRRTGYQQRISQIDSELAVNQNDIAHTQEMGIRVDMQIAQLTEQKKHNEQYLAQNAQALAEKEQELAGTEQELARCREKMGKAQQVIIALQNKIDEDNASLSALQQVLSEYRLGQATREAQIASLVSTIETRKSRIAQLEQELAQAQQELSIEREAHAQQEETIVQRGNMADGYLLKRKNQAAKLEQAVSEIRELAAKVRDKQNRAKMFEDLEKNLDGYQHSVRAIMAQVRQGNLTGIDGPVSRLITVEKEYTYAVETALGFAMQNIVVKDEQAAKQAISYLKRSGSGRATFLPLTTVRGRLLEEKNLSQNAGYLGLASELVSCQEEYRPVVNFLLGRTAVVETIDDAVQMARKFSHRFRIVTLDGSVINAGGSMAGGSQNRNASLLSRAAEIQSLEREISVLSEQGRTKNEQKNRLVEQLSSLDEQIARFREQTASLAIEQAKRQERLQMLEEKIGSSSSGLSQAKLEMEELSRQLAELQSGQTDDTQLVGETMDKINVLTGLIASKREELVIRESKLSQDNAEGNALEIRLAGQRKDVESLHGRAEEIRRASEEYDGRMQEFVAERKSFEEKRRKIREAQLALSEERETLLTRMDAAQEELAELSGQNAKLESQATQLRTQEKSYLSFREKISTELSKVQERVSFVQGNYDEIIAKLFDEYELTHSEAQGIARPVEDVSAAQAKLSDLRGRIRALGSVNVAAIEEYEQLHARYQFLKEQIGDAEVSRKELLELVNDLTSNMKTLFTECFEKVNRNFGTIFRELFGGGKAYFKLTDAENVLESGIEIFVEPPGKIIRNLSALSGGEQAFVAIAIYFAILKVKPTPFCVLDEIEAALDDVNVGKYAAYLKTLASGIQFILITHRRGTMEEADILYGVTMQEEGVSKLLKMDIDEIENRILSE
ncbi:MAG TPA: chromosome segregation protein SMC [Firmicutes bacterium]|nr:chromosome segregation protein SMC [Bacillota bacterium]